MNQQAFAENHPHHSMENMNAHFLHHQPVPDELMTTLIGVYVRLWDVEQHHTETLQHEGLMLQTRGVLVCIENYCLNGVVQHQSALRELANRLRRLQDSLFFASMRKSGDDIITIANAVAETVRFIEASTPHVTSIDMGDA